MMITSDNAYGALTCNGDHVGAVFVQHGRVRSERDWQAVLDAFLESAARYATADRVLGTYTLTEAPDGLLVTRSEDSGGDLQERRAGMFTVASPMPAATYGLLHVGVQPEGRGGGMYAVLVVEESAVEEGRPVMLASQVDGWGNLADGDVGDARVAWCTIGMMLLELLDTVPRRAL